MAQIIPATKFSKKFKTNSGAAAGGVVCGRVWNPMLARSSRSCRARQRSQKSPKRLMLRNVTKAALPS